MGPIWGPPGSCRPQVGPMLAPWTLLSGSSSCALRGTTHQLASTHSGWNIIYFVIPYLILAISYFRPHMLWTNTCWGRKVLLALDDNHLYYENQCQNTLKYVLENDVNSATTWFENNYMCANPDKFQSIILNRDGMQSLAISVQDYTIVSNSSIKVLGVTLDNKLKFDKHISEMCTKASRQINALKRVSKYLDENCRIMIYKTFMSSTFNYCPVSWMFCGKTNLNKLEKLQEKALRFVFRDTTSSYENLLTRGYFLPLSQYRIRCLAIEVYKCFNGLNPDYLNNLFKQPCLKYELRDSHRLEQPKFNTFTYGLRSFRYYGSKLWNVLPFSVKNTKELHVFKKNIIEWCHSTQCRSLDVFWHSDCIYFCLLPHFRPYLYYATLHILYINSCILASGKIVSELYFEISFTHIYKGIYP